LLLIWLLLPPAVAIVAHSVLLDGWRHLYFIYPALVLLAARAMAGLLGAAARLPGAWAPRGAAACWLVGVGVVAGNATALAALHPYESLYFNRLAGRDLRAVGQGFEVDYWGRSIRS
jgi:hypothetical protein